jgi:hypothetical protein
METISELWVGTRSGDAAPPCSLANRSGGFQIGEIPAHDRSTEPLDQIGRKRQDIVPLSLRLRLGGKAILIARIWLIDV